MDPPTHLSSQDVFDVEVEVFLPNTMAAFSGSITTMRE